MDRQDRRLLAKLVVIVAGAGGLLITLATVTGVAWRLFTAAAGV
ncbi:MAG: hypothetical protein AB7L91_08520 [Dehalococcoidia bacterium]